MPIGLRPARDWPWARRRSRHAVGRLRIGHTPDAFSVAYRDISGYYQHYELVTMLVAHRVSGGKVIGAAQAKRNSLLLTVEGEGAALHSVEKAVGFWLGANNEYQHFEY